MNHTPRLLTIGGFDPSGGAGLLADAIAAHQGGVAVVSVITAMTIQNSNRCLQVQPSKIAQVRSCLHTVASEAPLLAVKIGLIASAAIARVVVDWLESLPGPLPLVYDPVLRSSSGTNLIPLSEARQAWKILAPHCHVITPNYQEALALTQSNHLDQAAQRFLQRGICHVLATGGDHLQPQDLVQDHWFHEDATASQTLTYPRVECSYSRGTGCRFATSLAVLLGKGSSIDAALLNQAHTQVANYLKKFITT